MRDRRPVWIIMDTARLVDAVTSNVAAGRPAVSLKAAVLMAAFPP